MRNHQLRKWPCCEGDPSQDSADSPATTSYTPQGAYGGVTPQPVSLQWLEFEVEAHDIPWRGLATIYLMGYIPVVECEVEYTDEFETWWDDLTEDEQESVGSVVGLLEQEGPTLSYPYSSDIRGSRYGNMRELRIQHQGQPYRVLYAFDPRRVAILLLGGNKIGNDRWYEIYVPMADDLYEDHLTQLAAEEAI